MTLAISSYRDLPAFEREGRLLNLAWTTDEREFLSANLAEVLRHELADELQSDLPYVETYFVRDPYGEHILRDAVSRLFALDGLEFSISCGAGVNSLLHALAPLADGKPVYVIGDVYPDFPHWVARSGGTCTTQMSGESLDQYREGAHKAGSALVLIERPALLAKDLSLRELRELAGGVVRFGACVLIDESYANYYPPSFSAVRLVPEVANLAVLRGLSKAYSLGGLRLGYCVASRSLTDRVRAAIPPMLASSLSLRLARSVLGLGDVTKCLRERIVEAKIETTRLLAQAGVTVAPQGSPYMPHLVCSSEDAQEQVESRGIIGKMQPFWAGESRQLYRLSVPLAPARVQQFRDRIGGHP